LGGWKVKAGSEGRKPALRGFLGATGRACPANRAAGVLVLALVACALAAQSPQEPSPSAETQTAKLAGQEDAASAPAARSPEMQVSQTDAAGFANDGRVTWRRDWTSATSTSATVAFDPTTSLLAPSKDNLGPSINVGGLQGLGPSPDVPAYRADNLFRQGVQVRHAHGAHTFVFGFEISRRQYNGYRSDSSRPDIAFIADSQNDAITNTLNNGRSLRFGASFEF
jgi:hypothetical protein